MAARHGWSVELTRFRGHLTMLGGVHDGKAKKIFSGVAGGVSAVGSGRAITRGAGERVRADIAGDSEVGEAGRARRREAYRRSDEQGARRAGALAPGECAA